MNCPYIKFYGSLLSIHKPSMNFKINVLITNTNVHVKYYALLICAYALRMCTEKRELSDRIVH